MSEGIEIVPLCPEGEVDLPVDTPIYKYMSTEVFLQLLSSRTLIFTRLDQWSDACAPQRNTFRNDVTEHAASQHLGRPQAGGSDECEAVEETTPRRQRRAA